MRVLLGLVGGALIGLFVAVTNIAFYDLGEWQTTYALIVGPVGCGLTGGVVAWRWDA